MSTTKKAHGAAVVGLGLVTLSACGSSDGESGDGLQDRHARQPRLVGRLEERPRGLREAVRLQGQGPQGRRRRAGRQQGDPHQGQPAGRRLLRRRQHPAVPGARQRPLPVRTRPRAPTRSRPSTGSTRTSTGSRPSTPATSASTTTRRTSPSTSWPRRSPSTTWSSPRTRTSSSPRTPPPPRPASASCSAPPPSTATTGWQGYWKKLKANGVKVVDGWEQAYNEEFSGSAGGKKAKADRPLVVSYASSPPAEVIYADPKPTTAPTGVADRHLLPADRVRGAARATRRTPRAARRSSTSCSPRSSRRTCR